MPADKTAPAASNIHASSQLEGADKDALDGHSSGMYTIDRKSVV